MVSIAAFQAVDPGSIPGRRKYVFLSASKHAKVENTDFFKSLKKNCGTVELWFSSF